MNARGIIALVAVVHLGYRLAPVGLQAETFYVLRGIGGAVLFWALSRYVSGEAVIACWLGIVEESQTAVCGAVEYGLVTESVDGLCVDWLGRWPYLAAAAASLAYLHRGRIYAAIARIRDAR